MADSSLPNPNQPLPPSSRSQLDRTVPVVYSETAAPHSATFNGGCLCPQERLFLDIDAVFSAQWHGQLDAAHLGDDWGVGPRRGCNCGEAETVGEGVYAGRRSALESGLIATWLAAESSHSNIQVGDVAAVYAADEAFWSSLLCSRVQIHLLVLHSSVQSPIGAPQSSILAFANS
ncbi:hypothetical protein CVT26_009337 [Gymnopilus dilepis]|uniref:Uncharacterized protein n=1 Tax=Gymnopilus dilepis TaxID=231916 RepID=A0A409YA63_9AGAR|nr:hypothetical protein CVT26_009337 [Gymnopilus dilepis]